MDKIKRNERLGALTKILTDTPNRIHTLSEFCELFGCDVEALLSEPFTVVTPDTSNPFRQLYVAN